jgi:F0F1-type ATP synthase assembly protein I
MTQNSEQSEQPGKNRAQYIFNLTLAAVAGQVGFLTLCIVLVSLFGGLWLDKRFDSKPIFTVVLMLASVPVTIIMMFWVVRNATARIRPVPPDKKPPAEDTNRGTET